MRKLHMREFRGLVVGGVTALAALSGALAAVPAGAARGDDVGALHWYCGRAAPADDDTTNHHWVKREHSPAYMRIGSSTRCATNGGMALYLESLDYHCWALDINGSDTWTYVQNADAPSEQGWINDDYLNDRGSTVRCAGDAAFVGQ